MLWAVGARGEGLRSFHTFEREDAERFVANRKKTHEQIQAMLSQVPGVAGTAKAASGGGMPSTSLGSPPPVVPVGTPRVLVAPAENPEPSLSAPVPAAPVANPAPTGLPAPSRWPSPPPPVPPAPPVVAPASPPPLVAAPVPVAPAAPPPPSPVPMPAPVAPAPPRPIPLPVSPAPVAPPPAPSPPTSLPAPPPRPQPPSWPPALAAHAGASAAPVSGVPPVIVVNVPPPVIPSPPLGGTGASSPPPPSWPFPFPRPVPVPANPFPSGMGQPYAPPGPGGFPAGLAPPPVYVQVPAAAFPAALQRIVNPPPASPPPSAWQLFGQALHQNLRPQLAQSGVHGLVNAFSQAAHSGGHGAARGAMQDAAISANLIRDVVAGGRALHEFVNRVTESTRAMGQYNAKVAAGAMRLSYADYQRNFHLAHDVQESAAALFRHVNEMRNGRR